MTLLTKPKPFTISWPPALVLVILLAASQLLTDRYRVFPTAVSAILWLAGFIMVAYIAYAEYRLRYERAIIAAVLLVSLVTVLDVSGLSHLVSLLLSGAPGVHGARLLVSGLYFWTCNVLTFGLWFWLLDRGGPHNRARGTQGRADFLFPETTAGEMAEPHWGGPDLIEYMYLAYTNATAFSPTDTLPLSSRARALMALESTLSLGTIALVTARAVNILS